MATLAKPHSVETQTESPIVLTEPETPTKSGDEIWDELLATPESEAFLMLMIAEARREEANDTLIEGGWDAL